MGDLNSLRAVASWHLLILNISRRPSFSFIVHSTGRSTSKAAECHYASNVQLPECQICAVSADCTYKKKLQKIDLTLQLGVLFLWLEVKAVSKPEPILKKIIPGFGLHAIGNR